MDPKQRDDLIRFYSSRFGVPFDLSMAQMIAESSGNANAVSSEGARGLFQIMPATAVDLLYEEEVNVMISRFYLKLLYDRLKPLRAPTLWTIDRWRFALAAYNAGPGAVDRARQHALKPDSYDAIAETLPTETRDYVARIWTQFAHDDSNVQG